MSVLDRLFHLDFLRSRAAREEAERRGVSVATVCSMAELLSPTRGSVAILAWKGQRVGQETQPRAMLISPELQSAVPLY
jgi:hypothetical protein